MTTKKGREEILETLEEKARGVYQDSLKLMREGFHGLGTMATKTMEITRLKLSNQKALHRIRALFAELGQRVYDTLRRQQGKNLKITPDIFSFAEQIKNLQSLIEQNLEKLRHVTSVADFSQSPSSKRPATRSTSARRKAKKS